MIISILNVCKATIIGKAFGREFVAASLIPTDDIYISPPLHKTEQMHRFISTEITGLTPFETAVWTLASISIFRSKGFCVLLKCTGSCVTNLGETSFAGTWLNINHR